jgi:hypothetical protein
MAMRYKKPTVTIRDYLLQWYPTIDVQPVGQRLNTTNKIEATPTDEKPAKSQGIIRTILEGMNIGEITLVRTENATYAYESVDGGHRKRYIKAFFENEFPLWGTKTYYKDLSAEDKKAFLDTELTFCIYNSLSTYQKGYIFRNLNETTDVNHQEELNSYGEIPIAESIRETVRIVAGINNKINDLFSCGFIEKKNEYVFDNLSFNNSRLRMDEAVARFYFRFYDGGGAGKAADKDLKKMYQDESLTVAETAKLKSKVDKLLSFLNDMAYARKNTIKKGLYWKEFVMLSRLYFYMEDTYKNFEVSDDIEFYLAFKKVFDLYTGDNPKGKYNKLVNLPFDKAGRTVVEAFRGYMGHYDTFDKVNQTVLWMLEDFDILKYVKLKDPRRAFPSGWKEKKLSEQDYVDVIDGKPLNLDNSVMAHIISHKEGGLTVWKNLAVTSIEHNQAMGTMSLDQYKELLGYDVAA